MPVKERSTIPVRKNGEDRLKKNCYLKYFKFKSSIYYQNFKRVNHIEIYLCQNPVRSNKFKMFFTKHLFHNNILFKRLD